MTAQRDMFWQIDHVWVFYAAAFLATVLFAMGVAVTIQVWRNNAGSLAIPFSRSSMKKVVAEVILGRRLLRGNVAAGIMHLLIFWGFLVLLAGTCLLFVHDYLFSFLRGAIYLVYSLAMEAGGLMFITGIVWALVRRYLQRIPRLERRLEDALVPVWLVLIGLSGFMLEGLRLAYHQPSWAAWSFVGGWMGLTVSPHSAKALYPALWWGHGILSLGLIAVIPYTKLFHILAAPAAIYAQDHPKPFVPDVAEDTVKFDLGDSIFFDACMRCGRCVEACPSAGAGEDFAPREFVQAMRSSMWRAHSPWGDIRPSNRGASYAKDEKLWYCTTCRACLEVCPVYGAPFEAVMQQRMSAVEEGTNVPALLSQTLEKVFRYDNPWESSKRNRGAWAEGLDLVNLTQRGAKADLCYFVGCTTSFDETAKGMALSFSRILQTAGVRFGILGKKEPCCGDIARRTGEAGLFAEQTEKCTDLFEQYGITDVVTSSPHCFHTFCNEYPEASFTARHYTLVLRDLLAEGKLKLKKDGAATVTYHDPCYLGRANRIFDEPRQIIQAIPGMHLVEMAHCGVDSLCCGGGGGRMWQDLRGDVKMGEVRIREAAATGARILITACPLCRIMLEDARKSTGLVDTLEVMDLNELVWQSLEKGDVK